MPVKKGQKVRGCPPGCTCGRHSHKQSAKTKKKISEGLIRHYRKHGHLGDPDRKKCNRCKKWKSIDHFYKKSKTKLKSGDERQYYDSLCKPCRCAYNSEKMAEKTPEERSEIWRRNRLKMIDRHGHEEIKRRDREKKAIERDKLGKPPPKKRKYMVDREVDRKTLTDFVEKEMKKRRLTKQFIANRMGVNEKRLRVILYGDEQKKKTKKYGVKIYKTAKTISIDAADRVLLALDRQEEIHVLYPDET